jgi:hypothetical protein
MKHGSYRIVPPTQTVDVHGLLVFPMILATNKLTIISATSTNRLISTRDAPCIDRCTAEELNIRDAVCYWEDGTEF